jgi:transposase
MAWRPDGMRRPIPPRRSARYIGPAGNGLWWAQHKERLAVDYVSTLVPAMTIGVDLGDRVSDVAFIDGSGEERDGPRIQTTRERFEAYFSKIPPARIVIECGTHSPWVSRLLVRLGHEVIVANTSAMPRKVRKFDKLDARGLARDGRADPRKLYPIQHRGPEVQTDMALVRARGALVKARTELVNHARGVVKAFGYRLPACGSEAFAKVAKPALPPELKSSLLPVLGVIAELTKRIRSYDKKIDAMSTKYPEVNLLTQVTGVGPVTSLAFVLLIEDPKRFANSRDVGAYFGLAGKEHSSGQSRPQLRIP